MEIKACLTYPIHGTFWGLLNKDSRLHNITAFNTFGHIYSSSSSREHWQISCWACLPSLNPYLYVSLYSCLMAEWNSLGVEFNRDCNWSGGMGLFATDRSPRCCNNRSRSSPHHYSNWSKQAYKQCDVHWGHQFSTSTFRTTFIPVGLPSAQNLQSGSTSAQL